MTKLFKLDYIHVQHMLVKIPLVIFLLLSHSNEFAPSQSLYFLLSHHAHFFFAKLYEKMPSSQLLS